MERLIVLGTGNAQAIHCYNTCYAMQKGEEYFLVDAGGGNGILAQLDKAGITLESIHKIYVSGKNSYELVKNDDNSLWTIQGAGDEKEKTDSATVSSLVSSFGSMAYNSFVNYKCDDKSEYGLDDPYDRYFYEQGNL